MLDYSRAQQALDLVFKKVKRGNYGDKVPFSRDILHQAASDVGGFGNPQDILYIFRHGRQPLPARILKTVPPGQEISILNEDNGEPYFQYHPKFNINADRVGTPDVVYCNDRRYPLTESHSLTLLNRHRILESFFRGEYRQIQWFGEVRFGGLGQIDGVFEAVRNRDNRPVVICANAKTTAEAPSGLFAFHNAENVARRKFDLPVVHLFVYADVKEHCVHLYQVALNKNMTCSTKRGQSYHFVYRD